MPTPLPVQESERAPVLTASVSEGKRVWLPMRSEADVGRMTAVDIGVRNAGKNGEVLAVLLENFKVGRGRVVAARIGGEELSGQKAEVVADAEHAARDTGSLRAGSNGHHRVEKRQGKADTHATQQRAARDRAVYVSSRSVGFQHVICTGTDRSR